MDPDYEDYLMNLHLTNPTHNPSSRPLQPSKPTKFKKQKKTKPKPDKVKKTPTPESDPPPVSDADWPCRNLPPLALEWPVLKLPPPPATRLPTAEEQSRLAATQAQQNALKAAQEFFADCDTDDDEPCDGADDVDGDGDEDEFMDDEDGYEEHQFFVKVFTEDGEFRGFYEKNRDSGEFSCLVCGGIGQKLGKRFKGCVALVQHSNGIAKTKKKRAHRAFAQVICEVLGWDIDRLPTTSVLSLAKSRQCQDNAEVGMEDLNVLDKNPGSGNVISGGMILEGISNVSQEEELQVSSVPGTSNVVGDDVMRCENSLKVGDVDKCLEDLDDGNLSRADKKTQRAVNRLCKSISRTVVLETM